LDWTHKFEPLLPNILARLDVQSAITRWRDCRCRAPTACHSFKTLQAVSQGEEKSDASLQYYVFDLLHLDGEDLTAAAADRTQTETARRCLTASISAIVSTTRNISRASDFVTCKARCAASSMEGLISKRGDAPYRSGRGKTWLKVKCHRRQEFVIGGFHRADARRIAASAHYCSAILKTAHSSMPASAAPASPCRNVGQDLRKRLDKLTAQDFGFRSGAA
jgi:bifunctional non-homologous end joining protein LigD